MKTSLAALSAAAVLASAMLAIPAHAADADDPFRLSLAIKHAGEPVEHVTFFPTRRSRSAFSNSWEVLGERQLLVWYGKDEAWLVDLRDSSACRSLDKERNIAVSGGFADLKSNGYIRTRYNICRIEQIRPVDVEAMKADESAGETALAQS